MPIKINPSQPLAPIAKELTNRLITESQDVIDELDYWDLWKKAGTLRSNDVIRIEMGGPHATDGHAISNIQVKVNAIKQGKDTVAHVNVSDSIATADPEQQIVAVDAVRAALIRSLNERFSYLVTS